MSRRVWPLSYSALSASLSPPPSLQSMVSPSAAYSRHPWADQYNCTEPQYRGCSQMFCGQDNIYFGCHTGMAGFKVIGACRIGCDVLQSVVITFQMYPALAIEAIWQRENIINTNKKVTFILPFYILCWRIWHSSKITLHMLLYHKISQLLAV